MLNSHMLFRALNLCVRHRKECSFYAKPVVRDIKTLETAIEDWQVSKQGRRGYVKTEEPDWPLPVSTFRPLFFQSTAPASPRSKKLYSHLFHPSIRKDIPRHPPAPSHRLSLTRRAQQLPALATEDPPLPSSRLLSLSHYHHHTVRDHLR
jgi:hypothetical protein